MYVLRYPQEVTNCMETGAPLTSEVPRVGKRSRCHNSAVTNGTRLFSLANLDQRSTVARRIKDLISQISADRGGKDAITTAEWQLIRRAASLCVMAESIEADMAREMPFDLNGYGMITDRLRRVLESVGLDRRPRSVNDAPDRALADYFSRPAPIEAAAE
jgi:hypothetical protein